MRRNSSSRSAIARPGAAFRRLRLIRARSVGLQFLKRAPGGSLGTAFKSKAGLPVINIPGCPAHPDWVTQILVAVASGRAGDLTLDEFAAAEDLLYELHADRLHPQHALRL